MNLVLCVLVEGKRKERNLATYVIRVAHLHPKVDRRKTDEEQRKRTTSKNKQNKGEEIVRRA
jgi:hypothetical protein